MFEVLLVSCLAAGADCRTDRIPAGHDLAECRFTARALAADIGPPRSVQEYPCVPAGAGRPAMAMTLVAPGVFVHKGHHGADPDDANGGDLSNIGFIVGDKGVAVIDSGTHPGIGAGLMAAIRAETRLPVRWILLTHVHPDHSLGVRPLTADGGAVVAHRNYPTAMAMRASAYLANLERQGLTGLTEADIVMPDELVDGSRTIDLGGRELVLTAWQTAHTDNDMTVMDRATGTLFAGDLLFVDHTPVIDGSLKGWLAVMADLVQVDAHRAVPGHGPVVVDWPDGAAAQVRYLEAIAADTRAAIAAGMPMLDAIGIIGESARGPWLLFDRFNPRNATAAYQELEWE